MGKCCSSRAGQWLFLFLHRYGAFLIKYVAGYSLILLVLVLFYLSRRGGVSNGWHNVSKHFLKYKALFFNKKTGSEIKDKTAVTYSTCRFVAFLNE